MVTNPGGMTKPTHPLNALVGGYKIRHAEKPLETCSNCTRTVHRKLIHSVCTRVVDGNEVSQIEGGRAWAVLWNTIILPSS